MSIATNPIQSFAAWGAQLSQLDRLEASTCGLRWSFPLGSSAPTPWATQKAAAGCSNMWRMNHMKSILATDLKFRSWNLFVSWWTKSIQKWICIMEPIENRAGTPVLVTGTSSMECGWMMGVSTQCSVDAQSTLSRRPASSNIFRSAANCTWDTAQLSNPLGLHLNHDHNRKMVVAERDLPQTINLGIYMYKISTNTSGSSGMCGVWMACACKACCSSGGHAAKQGLAPQLGPSNKGPWWSLHVINVIHIKE